jgi:hypothetical protein
MRNEDAMPVETSGNQEHVGMKKLCKLKQVESKINFSRKTLGVLNKLTARACRKENA